MNDILFYDNSGNGFTRNDIVEALKSIGVSEGDNVFLHSDVMFGQVGAGFSRSTYLNELYSVFEDLNLDNLIVPTFTYSFCNNESYDVCKSKTTMGSLNEYIRKLDNRYRTLDPLLSLSVPEKISHLFKNVSDHSLGEGSGLDIIHNMDNVKFLFFGVPLGECFTYVHYVEKMINVPYRYDMKFDGMIIDADGNEFSKSQYIHTACYGVKPRNYYDFEDLLFEKGLLKRTIVGNKIVSCISERDAYNEIKSAIEDNINYFLEKPFTESDLIHKYTYEGMKKITHC